MQDHRKGNPLILTKENDLLGVLPKVEFLKGFIESNFRKKGLFDSENDRMIALYGGWGTGKSSVMKTLCESQKVYKTKDKIPSGKKAGDLKGYKKYGLDVNSIETIFFEAWKYEKDDDLALSLFTYLLHKIDEEKGWLANLKDKIDSGGNNVRKLLKALPRGVSGTVTHQNPETLVTGSIRYDFDKVIKSLESQDDEGLGSYYLNQKELKQSFTELLGDQKFVVFIDDLDRCESENMISLLSAIKLFFVYMPNIVFVAGIDKKAVTLALKRKYNDDEDKAEEYLEKIFTMSFNMPQAVNIENLIEKYYFIPRIGRLTERGVFIKDMFEAIGFTNPRHIKKFLNKIEMIEKSYFLKIKEDKNYRDFTNDEYYLFIYFSYLYEFKPNIFNELVDIKTKKKNRNSMVDATNGSDTSSYVNVPRDSYIMYMYLLPRFRKIHSYRSKSTINIPLSIYKKRFGSDITKQQMMFISFLEDKKKLSFNSKSLGNLNHISEDILIIIISLIKKIF